MKKRQMVFVGLIFIFCAPLLVAFILLESGYHPKQTTQHGKLLTPPILAKNLADKQWTLMIYLQNTVCGNDCQKKKQILPNVIRALGEKQHRVKNIIGTPQLDENLLNFPGWRVYSLPLEDMFLLEGIYIANPLGHIILYYPMDTEPRDILQDLRKLLKYSKIG